jgi:hypothetical protein
MLRISLIILLLSLTQSNSATPLEGRKFGVEFNIPRMLSYSKAWRSLSGSFSYFNHRNNSEIAFPWLIAKYGSDDSDPTNNNQSNVDTSLVNKSIDMHYRKFFSDELNGFYFSAFTRLSHFDGHVYTDQNSSLAAPSDIEKPTYIRGTEAFKKLRFGLGVGLGYRLFPKNKRLYWGAGIILGRYIDDKEYKFVNDGSPLTENTPIIVDIELLKFGYAF